MIDAIDVCICTFRRPSIADTIASVAAQDIRERVALRIIVADNDAEPSARALVEAAAAEHGVPLLYVHAPRQNISIARNACLSASDRDWLAFIDDDEVAPSDWLSKLIAAAGDAEIVFGATRALVAKGAPAWMADGSFHANRIAGRDKPHNGYTCNVLMSRRFIAGQGIHFLEELGQTGGEDTIFFHDLYRAGARFAYAPDAIVEEEIPANRARLGWLATRRYRAGQVHHFLLRRTGTMRQRAIAAAAAKLAYCYAKAALTILSRKRSMAAFLRGTLHLGFLAAALGAPIHREYGAKAANGAKGAE